MLEDARHEEGCTLVFYLYKVPKQVKQICADSSQKSASRGAWHALGFKVWVPGNVHGHVQYVNENTNIYLHISVNRFYTYYTVISIK